MATYTLEIPHANRNIPLSPGDHLKIKVTADCKFCHSDSDDCFPNGFLPTNGYTATHPPTVYGGKDGFLAVNKGSVLFSSVASGECDYRSIETGHSIVVS